MRPSRNNSDALALTRRQLFSKGSAGIGVAALASLLRAEPNGLPHFAPKAKRVIYLHQAGGPSQMDLFDHKPALQKLKGTELPDSIRKGQRITGMTSIQKSLPVAPPLFDFTQHGQSGAWLSELLPYTAKVVDEIAIVK